MREVSAGAGVSARSPMTQTPIIFFKKFIRTGFLQHYERIKLMLHAQSEPHAIREAIIKR